ncbi:hypothetical protein MASR2M39_27970 [Ignavibacteriales bacterium]
MTVTKPIALIPWNAFMDESVRKTTLLFSIILFLILTLPGYSTIRYVKAGNPTPVAPYTTWATASDSIQAVVDICLSGDTILIGSGVYSQIVNSENFGRDLTIFGVDVDSCIIDMTMFAQGTFRTAFKFKDDLILENLTFKTHNGWSNHVAIFLLGSISHCNTVNIDDCKFLGSFYHGIDIWNTTGTIQNSFFFLNSTAIMGPEWNNSSPLLISNNLFSRVSEGINPIYARIIGNSFIDIFNSAINFSNLFGVFCEVRNNFMHNRRQIYDGVINVPNTVNNNVITNFRRGIVALPGVQIENNVIMNSSEYAIYVDQPLDTAIINYNAFYNNREISNNTALYDPDTTIYYTADPMFENPDSNNYLLQMFSPLIDAGDPNILDVDGSRSDVGLYGGPYGQSYQYKDLPPKKPKVISATKIKNKVNFLWRGGTEADFNSFSLYRSRDPLFIPNDNNKIFTGIDTLFTDSLQDPTGSYSYKLTAKDNQGNVSKLDSVTVVLTGISAEEESPTPERIYLYQNYPNPFNPSTKIKFSLTEESEVILRVYDVNGALVTILQNGWLPAGEYEREFTPATIGTLKDIASGVYFYNLLVRDKNLIPIFVKTEKMIFLK